MPIATNSVIRIVYPTDWLSASGWQKNEQSYACLNSKILRQRKQTDKAYQTKQPKKFGEKAQKRNFSKKDQHESKKIAHIFAYMQIL